MARLKKQKYGSFFVSPSSRFARQTVYVTFILLLLPSTSFSEETEEYISIKICFSKWEDRRLNATLHKKLHAHHDVACVEKCVDDTCCRSVNFLKTLDGKKDEDNCELFHDVVPPAESYSLSRNDNYDYFTLNIPLRSFNCSCVSCENNKTCNTSSEKCECPTGFKGSKCEIDIDECISNHCDKNAKCKDGINSYTCECKEGFTGNGSKCTDIDECISKSCDINATCDNFFGSYNCTCKEGFTGDGTTCTDIDECISKPCDINATCDNCVGSYNCTCMGGFTGNGTACTDIDECISKPCDTNATCDNFVGSYNCTCKEGFTGDGTNCTGYASCTAIKTENVTTSSGLYNIIPPGIGFSSFKVDCNMTSKNGVGVTVIGHDSEARMEVDGYERPGSYSRKIKYDLPIELITAIIKTSMKCEQFIKYECHASKFKFSSAHHAWWVSRQGAKMDYWGGAAANSKQCACGMTNSCAGGRPCNCDANDNVWREDSGFLTDKNTLPVTELRFGDTGLSNEYGYHTLGKLMCWG